MLARLRHSVEGITEATYDPPGQAGENQANVSGLLMVSAPRGRKALSPLPRLFTTPTPQASILAGKLLAVFLTVVVQVVVLLVAAGMIFGVRWGDIVAVGLMAAGVVITASSFGIFFNSLLRSTRQSGAMFGGVLTITGMIGMITIFVQGSPSAAPNGLEF